MVNALLLLIVETSHSSFVDGLLMEHWQPLKARDELVHGFVEFVFVCYAADVDFNIVFSDQRLRLQIEFFDVERAATWLL